MNAATRFVTNEARILAYFSKHPESTVRTAAMKLDLTERTVIRLLGQLTEAGYLDRWKRGRGALTEVSSAASSICDLLDQVGDQPRKG